QPTPRTMAAAAAGPGWSPPAGPPLADAAGEHRASGRAARVRAELAACRTPLRGALSAMLPEDEARSLAARAPAVPPPPSRRPGTHRTSTARGKPPRRWQPPATTTLQ
ncbi:hypothetical protein ACFWVK_32685, partial [Streptomyces sp. NPDC058667]